jgi:peptide-methionine (S)-S-oxide reductase
MGIASIMLFAILFLHKIENKNSKGMANMTIQMATFGGGRFWTLQAVFQQIRGVKECLSGYAGGHLAYPSYEQVCAGDSGHAEVVRLQFDSKVVSYQNLLDIFFSLHKAAPTLDAESTEKSSHRSIVIVHNSEQKLMAQGVISKIKRAEHSLVATELHSEAEFFLAEEEHQNFYKKNPLDPYCVEFIVPKIILSRSVFKKKIAA